MWLRVSLKLLFCWFALIFVVGATAGEAPKKWLVLDQITYQTGVDKTVFEGIDNLLLTKLTQANKYKCLDRKTFDAAAREEAYGAEIELVPAVYSMSGEIVQLLPSGKTRTIRGCEIPEYIATISIRVNELRTQEAIQGETLRVTQYCETPKDMLSYVVQRIASSILMREFPLKVLRVKDGKIITLNYSSDFIKVGEQYEVRDVEEIVDEAEGRLYTDYETTGLCQVISVGQSTSRAHLISGKVEKGARLYYSGMGDDEISLNVSTRSAVRDSGGAVLTARPRIAVASFNSKEDLVRIKGHPPLITRSWMDDARQEVIKTLVAAGGFKVLDRSFDSEIDHELDRINNPNADPGDISRLSRQLVADYLVVVWVKFVDVFAKQSPSTVFAKVNFQCMKTTTKEVLVSGVKTLEASVFADATTQVATYITDQIQRKLAPQEFERVQKERDEELNRAIDWVRKHGESEIKSTRTSIESAEVELTRIKADAATLKEAISNVMKEYNQSRQKAKNDSRKSFYDKVNYVLMLLNNEVIKSLYKQYLNAELDAKLESYRAEIEDANQKHKESTVSSDAKKVLVKRLNQYKRDLSKAQREKRAVEKEIVRLTKEYSHCWSSLQRPQRGYLDTSRAHAERKFPDIVMSLNDKKDLALPAAKEKVERYEELIASVELELANVEADEKENAASRDIEHKNDIIGITERYERETVEVLQSSIVSRENLVHSQIDDAKQKLKSLRKVMQSDTISADEIERILNDFQKKDKL